MAEKLSWTELRKALATRAGVSEKTAGVFLNALTAQLTEGLRSDKQVKINGLGTFKLQAVAPRKSVNVSTGEEIIIEGYNKVVFSPEAGVKEMIEKGGEVNSEATDVVRSEIDPLKKLGEQADEIVGLLADLGQNPQEEPKPRGRKKQEEPVVEEPPVVESAPMVEPEPEPEPVDEAETVTATPPPATPKKPKGKKNHFFRDLLICVIVLILLLVGGYFLIRNKLSSWLESLVQEPKPQTEQVEPVAADTVVAEELPMELIPEGDIPQKQIYDEFLAVSEDIEMEEPPYSDLITIEEMHEGSRLTWMAKRFYGDKRFWPYIYDANRDRIVNPSNIEVGTPLRIPRLTAEQMDTTNAESRAALERLRIEAEEACRK